MCKHISQQQQNKQTITCHQCSKLLQLRPYMYNTFPTCTGQVIRILQPKHLRQGYIGA